MPAKLQMAILGCGDFLRWMTPDVKKSKRIAVKYLYDPDQARAQHYAEELGGSPVSDADVIFDDPAVSIVCLFVPPWARREMTLRAARAGKHILTTKPLAPSVADCKAIVEAVKKAKVQCGVMYRRTGNTAIELYKRIFKSGGVGRLALYKQDWLHHYPQWNTWATDPAKNGGPFMDAMIHNMNIARYLMGRPATAATFFADSHSHPELKCRDTEFMKLDFGKDASAHLFITWAADLEVMDKKGNNREHIDIIYMVTDKGWRLTEGWEDGKFTVTASRGGKKKKFVAKDLADTPFDAFARTVATGAPLRSDIVSVTEAAEDIAILKAAEKAIGKTVKV